MSKIIGITGLWKQTDANGRVYLAGSLGFAKILIFRNEKKENERQPDYRFCIAESEKKEQEPADEGGESAPF